MSILGPGKWDDVQGEFSTAGGSALVLEQFRDTGFLVYHFINDAIETISIRYQLPHGWNRGAVKPHAHVVPLSNPGVAEAFLLDGWYTWCRSGVAIPAVATWTTFSSGAITVNPGDAFIAKYVALATVTPPAGTKESDFLLLHLRRNATDPLDTYTTNKVGGTVKCNLALLAADVHYQKAKLGTVPELPA